MVTRRLPDRQFSRTAIGKGVHVSEISVHEV